MEQNESVTNSSRIKIQPKSHSAHKYNLIECIHPESDQFIYYTFTFVQQQSTLSWFTFIIGLWCFLQLHAKLLEAERQVGELQGRLKEQRQLSGEKLKDREQQVADLQLKLSRLEEEVKRDMADE